MDSCLRRNDTLLNLLAHKGIQFCRIPLQEWEVCAVLPAQAGIQFCHNLHKN